MQVFKTIVPTDDEMLRMDTIEHQGLFWLVPQWIDTPRKGWSKPARIVCLSLIPHQTLPGPDAHFFVQNLVPKSVFDGAIPPQIAAQYTVIDLPDLEFETHASGPVH